MGHFTTLIDNLIVTDVVMPGINGRQMVDKVKTVMPDIRALFMSGYTANVIAHRGVLDGGVNFIQKPYSLKEIASKIREILDI